MPLTSKIVLHSLRFNPRDNFGHSNGREEENLVKKFAIHYADNFTRIHKRSNPDHVTLVREVPVNSLGISDLVAISWKADVKRIKLRDYVIRSFEFKINDWKKGLMQAYRYNYYSDASILVMPENKHSIVKNYLTTFYELNVGMWFYDSAKDKVNVVFTPRPKKPEDPSKRDLLIQNILESVDIN